MINHYETLGVPNFSDLKVITEAYRRQLSKYHPDRNSDSDATRKTVEIRSAFEYLKDESNRRRLDTYLSRQDSNRNDAKREEETRRAYEKQQKERAARSERDQEAKREQERREAKERDQARAKEKEEAEYRERAERRIREARYRAQAQAQAKSDQLDNVITLCCRYLFLAGILYAGKDNIQLGALTLAITVIVSVSFILSSVYDGDESPENTTRSKFIALVKEFKLLGACMYAFDHFVVLYFMAILGIAAISALFYIYFLITK